MSFHVEHTLVCVIPLQEKWASYQWCFPQLARGVGRSSSFGVGNDVIGLMETKDILKHLHGLFKLEGKKEKGTYSRKHTGHKDFLWDWIPWVVFWGMRPKAKRAKPPKKCHNYPLGQWLREMELMNKDKENPFSNIIDMCLTSPIANQHLPLVLWISEIIS